jgi:hypothetical protein
MSERELIEPEENNGELIARARDLPGKNIPPIDGNNLKAQAYSL